MGEFNLIQMTIISTTVGENPLEELEPSQSTSTEMQYLGATTKMTGEGDGTPLQCSCLENPMDRGAWWAVVHGVAKSWTRLSYFTYFISSNLQSH